MSFENTLSREPLMAAVYVSDFALQAVMRLERFLGKRPLALVGESGRKAVVHQVNAAAREAGVTVGMTAPQALARCPEAVLRSRSEEGEKSAREALLAAAFTLSPRVEETGEGFCTIDLRGAPRERLIERGKRLVEELEKLGLEATAGFGRNPLLALFAARRAEPVLQVNEEDEASFLRGLPVSMADPPEHVAGILRQWGIKTLGSLAALSRQELAKRLGEEGAALWDRAAGRDNRVLRLTTLPEEFEEVMELEREMETLEPLLFILRRFIGQLSLRLSAVYRVAEEVKLELGLTDGSKYEREFRLPEPTCDSELLFRMLHTHLEGVRTEFPIVKIYLWMKPCKPVSRQYDLFEAAVKDAYSFSDTLARLVAVAGSGNVGSPRLEPTHRPDSFRLVPLAEVRREKKSVEKGGKAAGESVHPGLPMRRYRPPLTAEVWQEDGRPTYVKTEVVYGKIRDARGPWRLSGNWWDPGRWGRDEWDVELAGGGLYRLVREGGGWFLEGEYG